MRIGIMQGRLVPPENGRIQSFPHKRWRDEFALARAAGIEYIEWIVDSSSLDVNPIFTIAGRKEMAELKQEYGIDTPAICADWFMEHPLREGIKGWMDAL